ncbi:MAG: hypothetical protein J6N76_03510 [Lachnospiraceae bacterium]|nr:hypothetical protein [Lachnospiraceae bacterium]
MSDQLVFEALKQKTETEQQYLEQESNQMMESMQRMDEFASDESIFKNRHYSFLSREESKVSSQFDDNTDQLENQAVSAAPELKQQQAKSMTKSEAKIVKKEKQLLVAQARVLKERVGDSASKSDAKAEEALLESRLELIKAQADHDLDKALNEREKEEILVNMQQSIVDARTSYAYTLPIGSKARRKAMAQKEADEIQLFRYKWTRKIGLMPPGKEKAHEKTQYSHKYLESIAQSSFSKNDTNCEEDATLTVEIGGKATVLVNTGRAFMGGSKPSYYFTDKSTGKRYLYKKAENCCGLSRPKGAIMTEIGGKLQTLLDPEHAIPAIGITNEKGKYIGSLQEIIEVKKDGFDFNSWQHQPEETRSTDVFTNEVKEQMLTFHAIDWLLCNYDTKGENLLQRSDGSFVSIDKEGAMSHILEDGTFDMSIKFSPHTDEPVYNTFFRMYRDGKIDIPDDMVESVINKVESLDDNAYMKLFEPYLNGIKSSKKDLIRNEILRRKKDIRQSYDTFFRELKQG